MKKAQSELATILVVSSDEASCNVVRQALERADYCVLEVRDAKAALEICRQSMERIRGAVDGSVPYRCQDCRTRFYRFGIRLRRSLSRL